MLGDSSTVLATTTTAAAAAGGDGGVAAASAGGSSSDAPPPSHQLPGGGGVAHESTSEVAQVGSNNSFEDDKGRGDEGDRSFGGNRWPRQETLALLKIRSDMDVAFRDASVKGPLWEEISRKLAELGYNRSAKKCKEKFENVFKYHKRTREGRTGKQEGKTYRFFDQLEAFENHASSSSLSSQPPPPPPPQTQPQQVKPQTPAVTTIAMPVVNPPITTVPSTTTKAAPLAANMSQGIVSTGINLSIPSFPPANPTILPSAQATTNPTTNPSLFSNFSPDLFSNSTSSSTSSDVELHGRHGKKRKWKDFFERIMKEVIHKQEDMQRKFLEAIAKREHDRMIREESWRMQEMTRINREREILAQERSMAAAKDAAIMAFLQKLSDQQNPGQVPAQPPAAAQQPPPPQPTPQPITVVPVAPAAPAQPVINLDMKSGNGDQSFSPASSSRWPKVEVEALIKLRTNLDCKYPDNGPKGPLWEDISAGMRKLGYNRSAKRCKEKWENINKYFKKVKESNKRRPEDSKTCPYFHQLDALYKNKNKSDPSSNIQLKPENSVPLMVRPEQQWPPAEEEHNPADSVMEDLESDHQDEDDKDNDDDEDEEDEAGGYEIVANRPSAAAG
ncbi:trihelix transcription factor DF1 [Manihot esculenta]|uniref:Myb-like domain-containing protein n=1 Tax=Manihot esculenta TaxID=3983 RepID=A0A2C9U2N2_MANES|nr:trihelix transcription factor DF1 [Manihot esculenta]OAY23600.1 hypothetical protein MANES_18G091600v8 [Manihot esculenta]